MSAPQSLRARVERYLTERRRLGFGLRSAAYALRGFARHVQSIGHHGPLTVGIMAEWARRDSHGSSDPHTWARRIKQLRPFTRWLQQFEPLTEVPEEALFGRLPQRQAPHIYNDGEIVDLLAAAPALGPSSGLRGMIFETLFGMIACTGLRISEALALRNEDVDLVRGMLTIRQTKFAKSRQVPLHHSTIHSLRRYRSARDLSGESTEGNAPFFIGTRGRRRGLALGERQVHRVFAGLRKRLDWRNRSSWYGVLAPAGVAKDIIVLLNGAIVKVLGTPEMKEALNREGTEPQPTTPEQFAAFICRELAQNAELIKLAGAKAE